MQAQRRFEVVICEAVDRLGRRLADTADLQDTLAFHKVRLFTPSLGEVTQIHVAVMGMMAQMSLKDLGEKTKRGQLGRVMKGRVAGGLAYGYRVAATTDGAGARAIEPEEASDSRADLPRVRVGQEPRGDGRGTEPRRHVGPGGRPWSNTTIRGQVDRGTGLLNNGLYRGVLEWNRCSYVKDPRTGKRVARPNPPELWEVKPVPELRIVDDELWQRVKARQLLVRAASNHSRQAPRPKPTGRPDSQRPQRGASLPLSSVGPDDMRLLRGRLHHHRQGPLWLRHAPPEGHLRQRPHDHPAGDRGAGAGRPQGAAARP